MERQRVIVIAPKDPLTTYGGPYSYLRAYGRAAIAAGYEPHLFFVGDHDAVVETDFGIAHRIRSPVRPFRAVMVPLHQPYIVAGIMRALGNDEGPFLIHGFGGWSAPSVALGRRLRRRGGKATVLLTFFTTTRHEQRGKVVALGTDYPLAVRLQFRIELVWTNLVLHPRERRAFQSADQVLANYDSVRSILAEDFGSGVNVRLSPYAAETAFTRDGVRADAPAVLSTLEPADAPLVVSVSRHDPRKGLGVLIRALGVLKARGVRFRACLVGGNQLVGTHRQFIDRLGLAGSVICPGPVADAYAFLQHADIFVLPSLEEGSGSVSLLEAMQARVAAIASDVDGIAEDAVDGESALLVPPGDVTALADAIERLLGDEALRARLAGRAEAIHRTRFSPQVFTADLKALYTSFGFPGSPGTPGRAPALPAASA